MNCSAQSLIQASKCWDCIPAGMQGAVQTMLMCEWAEGGGGTICDDPVVADWLQRLANDFQPMPSVDTINAVCDFCAALRIAGIMDKMLVVNPIIPDSFLAMRYPLIYQVGNGNSPFINVNFVAADLDNNGLLGDGLTKHMDTGFNPRTQWAAATESAGITIYESEPTPQNVSAEFECGVENFAIDEVLELSTWEPTLARGAAYCWDNASGIFAGLADTPAFYSCNRISNVDFRVFQANTIIPFNTLGTQAADQTANLLPNASMTFMAINNYQLPIIENRTYKRVSFMAIHEGLTAAEAQDFYDAVYDLRFALGGGYV